MPVKTPDGKFNPISKPPPRFRRPRKDTQPLKGLRCELCGKPAVQKHHVKTRGSGGGDENENRLDCCLGCHAKIHSGEIPRERVERFVAERNYQRALVELKAAREKVKRLGEELGIKNLEQTP